MYRKMGNIRDVHKRNEDNLMRINLACEQGRRFLDKMESNLIKKGSCNSYLLQLIETSKSEIAQLHKKYASFVEECNFDVVLVDAERVKNVKETVEMMKAKITDIVNGNHHEHTLDYLFPNLDNDQNQLMET